MKIVIVNNSKIPVFLYGGTQRVIWFLGKELAKQGHDVVFLVEEGSQCDFAKIISIRKDISILDQVPRDTDVVHFQFEPEGVKDFDIPYVITMHGNINNKFKFDKNTIFVSENHAFRHNSRSFVYNGMDWDEYIAPNLEQKRNKFHFLGNASWKVKNLNGAIDVVKFSKKEKLNVLGGVRFNFNMGIRLTFSPKISFEGMVGGAKKSELLNNSKGLIFPVKWHEPFGIAITESLFYGCPVFATPYGSLPEIVTNDFGVLSKDHKELSDAILSAESFSKRKCHEYARDVFNSYEMSLAYLEKYKKVMLGEKLNDKPPCLIEIQESKYLEWK
jgi:glycosyltransferase involved in cell wall biosynthesis